MGRNVLTHSELLIRPLNTGCLLNMESAVIQVSPYNVENELPVIRFSLKRGGTRNKT